MKRVVFFFAALFCMAIASQTASAQSTGDYRSAATGNWNTLATWERFNGTTWVTPTAGQGTPDSGDGVITIQSPHTVTVTANVTIDQTTINSGGQVTVNSGITLTIANGTGTDLTVNGILRNSAGTITTTGTLAFGSGGTYQHNFTTTAGTIPTATWNVSSTCEIIGYTSNTTAPSGLAQTFGNFTWNCTNQNDDLSLGGGLNTVAGDFNVISTGTGDVRLGVNGAGNLTISGDFSQTGGLFFVSGGADRTVTLAGNFSLSNGTSELTDANDTISFQVAGNFSHTGGTITEAGAGNNKTFFFNGAGTQTYTSGGTVTNTVNFTVNSGSTLQMGTGASPSTITGGGAFTLSSGAALGITSTAGITSSGATGNIQSTGTRSFNTAANYIYNGAASQATGNGLPATVNNLTIANTGATDSNIVTLTATVSASGALAINDGILSLGATTSLSVTGATTIASGGTLFAPSGATGNFTFSSVTVNSGGGWEVFGGTAGNQVVVTLSGSVTNNGLIHFDSAGTTCGDADNIQIRSSVTGTQRTWSGSGLFRMQDVDVRDQSKSGAPNITANSSTNTGNNTNWTFTANCNAVTEVTLASFAATVGDKQGVYLQWRTGYEVKNLGFNIYREQGGKRAKVNASLIAGSALMVGSRTTLTAGLSYAWLDTAPAATDFVQYWLEDIDLNGKRTLHGPISPVSGGKFPAQANALLLSKLNSNIATVKQRVITPFVKTAVGFGKGGVKTADTLQTQWDIAGQAGAKLSVRADGWYRVTQPELVAAGFDVSRNPLFLQLYVDGVEQPIKVNGGASGHLDAGDSIEFYAKALDTISTDLRVYYLINGKAQGRRVNVLNSSGVASTAQSFPSTIERKERSTYFAALKNGDADNWFGPIIAADLVTQTLAVEHLDTNAATGGALEIALQGVTADSSHSVKVLLNGNDVGTINFNGQTRQVSTLAIANSALLEGNNIITLEAQGGDLDINLLDYVRLTYAHTFAADNNSLLYTVAGQELVTISGFNSPAIRALDITDPNNVKEISGTTSGSGGSHSITVAAQDIGQRVLYVFVDSAASHPAQMAANLPSNWNRANQVADLVIITHRNFTASLDPLKAFRSSQGYKVVVADAEDLYDEFSFGARAPQAIKDFLAQAKSVWKRAPKFVLLAGDASSDPKNYLGLGDADFVPTKLIDTEQMETASDDWLVDFNNDGLPDMAVGRLPVRTAGESSTMVTKIIAYAQLARPEVALMVTDRNDDFNFEAASSEAKALLPASITVREVFRSALDDETAHSQIVQEMGRGPKIVNYLGHGSFGLWRGNLLTTADAANLNNGPEYSFIVMMTCLNGQFQDPFGDGLAEALMKAEQGGAIAVWASSALTEPSAQALMNKEVFRQLFPGLGLNVQPLTLGEAVMRSKAASSDLDARRTWILFGDPTTKLR